MLSGYIMLYPCGGIQASATIQNIKPKANTFLSKLRDSSNLRMIRQVIIPKQATIKIPSKIHPKTVITNTTLKATTIISTISTIPITSSFFTCDYFFHYLTYTLSAYTHFISDFFIRQALFF